MSSNESQVSSHQYGSDNQEGVVVTIQSSATALTANNSADFPFLHTEVVDAILNILPTPDVMPVAADAMPVAADTMPVHTGMTSNTQDVTLSSVLSLPQDEITNVTPLLSPPPPGFGWILIYTAIPTHEIPAYVINNSPPDADVYAITGLTTEHGIGLYAIPPYITDFTRNMSFAMMIHLAIVGSPLRALSGYHIIAAIEARFRKIYCRPSKHWQKYMIRIKRVGDQNQAWW
ncbi:hypothetical protein C8Q76DRAFT_690222 [Earliella scabrosa]|nr:hypothetical protein C8Q76DRAFT_690222 [Earliella scabrosa]